MRKYTKTKVIRITEDQHKTLQKMKSYNVDVGNFIREAIREKIQKEYLYILEKKKKNEDPFLYNLDKAIKKIKNKNI